MCWENYSPFNKLFRKDCTHPYVDAGMDFNCHQGQISIKIDKRHLYMSPRRENIENTS